MHSQPSYSGSRHCIKHTLAAKSMPISPLMKIALYICSTLLQTPLYVCSPFLQIALYICSPRLAYNFSELLESHAVDTYGEFVDANEQQLKELQPPLVAAQYYRSPDLYM